MFALSGERNLLSSLVSYIPPQPLVPLQVWAYTTTSQDSRKPRAWKHLLCRKIQKQCTQQEHSGRKAAPESSEKTDCNLCHWMQQQNQIFTDRRVRRNHVVQLYCISRSQRGFQTIHYKGLILRMSKWQCSLALWVTCPRPILKLKKRFHGSCHYT